MVVNELSHMWHLCGRGLYGKVISADQRVLIHLVGESQGAIAVCHKQIPWYYLSEVFLINYKSPSTYLLDVIESCVGIIRNKNLR